MKASEQLKNDRIKVVNETVEFYKTNPRSTTINGRCQYYSVLYGKETGCAVGRLIDDKGLCRDLDSLHTDTSVKKQFMKFPENVKKYGLTFLSELQSLHDDHDNWISDNDGRENVLSIIGKRAFDQLLINCELAD